MSGGRIRTALVGYGFGGSIFHAPFIAADERMDLSAVVTASSDRQADIQARYRHTSVLDSFDQLLARLDEVDLVVISTPNVTHVSLAEAVLQRGTPVVVDKPLAPTTDEVRHLIEVAELAGCHLVPFQNRRWDGDFRTVRSLVESGSLGRVHRFESRYERWQPQMAGGTGRSWKRDPSPGHATGILYDLGTHLIDQTVALFGRADSVYAEVERRRNGAEVDDDVFVALGYRSGLVCHLWASAVAADRGPRFRVLGDGAAYVKHGMDIQEAALLDGRRPTDDRWGVEPPDSWGCVVRGEDSRPEPTLPGAYQLFYSGLAACLLDGGAPPVDASDAVCTAEILEAARRSAATRQVVAL